MQIDIIITVILFVVALLRPQSKGVAVLIFALMWSLWGWNTWNGDYEAYAEIFINPNFATSELGYTILNKFIGLFTDDYQVFVIIISFMLLSSILLFIVRLSPYPALFSVIYFVIYLEEFVFIRNYILSTLLLHLSYKTSLSHVRPINIASYIGTSLLVSLFSRFKKLINLTRLFLCKL